MHETDTPEDKGALSVLGAVRPAAALRPSPPSSTQGWLGALQRTAAIGKDPRSTLPVLIERMAEVHAEAPALIGPRERFTYRELAARQAAYARWAQEQGLGKGDTVCLLMLNRPDYVAIWLGLTRIGVVVALLNTNLTGTSLAHCIETAVPTGIIVADDLVAAYETARPRLGITPAVWVHGSHDPVPSSSGAPVPLTGRDAGGSRAPREAGGSDASVSLADPALLIFTSGTTGLPKAAYVGHHRLVTWSHWFAGLVDTRPEDRIYNCLPLYHSIGGVVAIGSMLVSGGSVVIAERFSASRFWRDVVTYDCTLFQYIGELCRYLLNAPPDPCETQHRLRLCAGNGLRADVWDAFQARFAIPRILEFYASTEGTVSFYNVEGEVGSIGRVPSFMAHRSAAALVRHDVDSETAWRDETGRCSRVSVGETGELIGRLGSNAGQPAPRFEGYTNATESSRKVLRDVFEPGDAWFRTGDLLRQDRRGFFYFVDRVGDTFRWKGENVSTTEVAEAVGRSAGVEEAVVYGVSVRGFEGRAGMAALRINDAFDLDRLRQDLDERLPLYARPVFLRLSTSFDTTETFKLKKAKLVFEGFDPARTTDRLFVDDRSRGVYTPIDQTVFETVIAGRLRL